MSTRISPALAANTTAFAFDLYREIAKQEGNLFFSPSSIATALAMAYAGARGETAAQMARALHLGGAPDETHAAFAAFRKVVAELQKHGKVRLHTAAGLWPAVGEPLLADYLHLLQSHYGTEVTPVDFRDGAGTAALINAWVERQTHGSITHVVQGLDPLTRLVLVSAIYFRGKWLEPFPPHFTRRQPFWLGLRESAAVLMMGRVDRFPYAEADQLQLLELAYAGEEVAMLVLLPRSKTGLADLERSLTTERLEGWCRSLEVTEVDVRLPRFRIDSTLDLSAILRALGMREAFDAARADFSGMDGRPHWLFLSRVIHKAFVDVDETGTEAAAATAIVVSGGFPAWSQTTPPAFHADHPFLVVIRERSSGAVLFLGRVANPVR